MRQRLQFYNVLPRVRSNSFSTLVASPPSSTSRQVLPAQPKLPSDAPKQSQHSQLALAQPTLSPNLFPCTTPPLSPKFKPVYASPSSSHCGSATKVPKAHKRQRLQYQLNVGAYGIPKNRHHSRHFHSNPSPDSSLYPHTTLSVQVGEDSYFVRDNAMGIADGVGGWSRSVPHSSHHPTPSALFSRRLMHFCAAEVEALNPHSKPDFSFSFEHSPRPRPAPPHSPLLFSDLEDSLNSSLEELSEGIDVLNILERAYDSTVKFHLVPSTPTPLTTGSSTALLAVLDHPPLPSPSPPSVLYPQSPEFPHKNYAVGSYYVPPQPTIDDRQDPKLPKSEPYDAVLRIAHLGDCMGMLVRGENIVWRSDEMWWGYNHPLQLGPPSGSAAESSSSTSTNAEPIPLPVQPHTFTLPVLADDILILASDGLSDNLWDEDVLDEVLRFKKDGIWGTAGEDSHQAQVQRRKLFANLLSEALCSRAKKVSEVVISSKSRSPSPKPKLSVVEEKDQSSSVSLVTSEEDEDRASHRNEQKPEFEVPFGRRARLAGKAFNGGKQDDISVIVAVISPSPPRPLLSSPSSGPATSSNSTSASSTESSSASNVSSMNGLKSLASLSATISSLNLNGNSKLQPQPLASMHVQL